jgi:thioesterase domain-containing protein
MIRQIQKRPAGSDASPLFLFHDASGTISNYLALGLMGRDVYAIANSRVKANGDESLQEMSRRYYALIKSTISEGTILLGGIYT